MRHGGLQLAGLGEKERQGLITPVGEEERQIVPGEGHPDQRRPKPLRPHNLE